MIVNDKKKKRLLVCTQAVDLDDPVLGFFHRWIEEFSRHFDALTVVCLKEGRRDLPANVRVFSLGKETKESRVQYVSKLLRYVWRERAAYDAVFVHQNQEYVLLAGLIWKLLGKRLFMWRNHYAGSFSTRIAGALCAKVFYTSKHSYTATFPNAVQMPVGVDLSIFKTIAERAPRSVLFLGRIASSKHPDVLVEALGLLAARGIDLTASLCGPTLPHDEAYRASLARRISELGLEGRVSLRDGVPHAETPVLYAAHEMFVNLSDSGMYDKTLFEAAASGCIVISTSKDFARVFDERFTFDGGAESLAEILERGMRMSDEEKERTIRALHAVAQSNDLLALGTCLAEEMKP